MSQPYDIPGKLPHDPSKWEWKDLGPNGGYWVLKDSEKRSYNCSEFAMAKIEGRPPRWGGDGSQTTETHEIETELRRRGFSEPGSPAKCGTGPGQMSQCVVLYFSTQNGTPSGEPFHVEVFDPIHGDWGGKGSSGLPIRHRQDPTAFPTDPEERKHVKAVFLCRAVENGAWTILSDEVLHDGAVNLDATPVRDAAKWLLRTALLLGGGVGGWLLRGWLE